MDNTVKEPLIHLSKREDMPFGKKWLVRIIVVLSTLAGGVGQISVAITGEAYRAKIPLSSKILVIGDIFFNMGS